MTNWTSDELDKIGRAEELEIAGVAPVKPDTGLVAIGFG
jgi:hypothetical protein